MRLDMHAGFSCPRLPHLPTTLILIVLILTVGIPLVGCGPTADPPAEPPPPPSAPRSGPGTVVASDGVEIAYTIRGQGEPALVFIHGWLCDQSFWSEQVEVFAAGHTVVTLDLAGVGGSGAERSEWTLEAFGGDVHAVLEDLGLDSVILIGHSMGGPVALEAARLLPDAVVGIVGVDTFHNAERQMDPKQLEGYLKAYEADFVGTCERFVRSMSLPESDAALVTRTIDAMCSAPPEIAIAQLREFSTYDMTLAMRRVTAPIRSVNAAMYPTQVESNRQYAPTFDAKLMDGVGHFLMMERPREFNELLAAWVADLKNRLVTIDP